MESGNRIPNLESETETGTGISESELLILRIKKIFFSNVHEINMGKCFAVFPSLLSASTTRFNLVCWEKQTYLDETSSFAYPKREA